MIDSLRGTLLEKTPDAAVVECAGVGYRVQIPTTTAGALPAVGESCRVYTDFRITENDVALYGFSKKAERDAFRMMTAVSGVGPKAGLAILSVMTPERIALAAAGGDHKAFTAAPGVGPKLAQRIVLELKDKMKGFGTAGVDASALGAVAAPASSAGQAAAALVSLGYTGAEAAQALTGLDPALPVQELIRLALQGIGKRR